MSPVSSDLELTLVGQKGFAVWPEKEPILAGPKWEISSGQGGLGPESCPLK